MTKTTPHQAEPRNDPLVTIPPQVHDRRNHVSVVAGNSVRRAIWNITQATYEHLTTAILTIHRAGLPPLFDTTAQRCFLPVIADEFGRQATLGAGPEQLRGRAAELQDVHAQRLRQGL